MFVKGSSGLLHPCVTVLMRSLQKSREKDQVKRENTAAHRKGEYEESEEKDSGKINVKYCHTEHCAGADVRSTDHTCSFHFYLCLAYRIVYCVS